MDVVYLDFDGVLHPEDVRRYRSQPCIRLAPEYADHELFENCAVLEDLLAPFPTLSLVLSTTWVQVVGFSRAKGYLSPRLRERVCGATYHSIHHHPEHFSRLSRYHQILSDVARRQPARWLAVDDNAHGWDPNVGEYLVHMPAVGLADLDAQVRLREGLERIFSMTMRSK